MKDRFASVNLKPKSDTSFFPELVQTIGSDEELRSDFMTACLVKLGLKVNRDEKIAPPLSPLHLTGITPSTALEARHELRDIIETQGEKTILKDEQDTFEIIMESSLNMSEMQKSLPEPDHEVRENGYEVIDYTKVVKKIIVHNERYPSLMTTPQFDHELYYDHFHDYENTHDDPNFGCYLLYGEVVTSTNSLLEK